MKRLEHWYVTAAESPNEELENRHLRNAIAYFCSLGTVVTLEFRGHALREHNDGVSQLPGMYISVAEVLRKPGAA